MASLSKSFIAVGGLLSTVTVNAQTSYSSSSIQSMSPTPTAVRQAPPSSPTTAGSAAQSSMIPSSASPTLTINNYPTPLPTSLGSQSSTSTSISPSSSGPTILISSSSGPTESNIGPTPFPTSIGSQQSSSSSGSTSTSPSPNPSTAGTASVTVLTDTDSPTADVASALASNIPSTNSPTSLHPSTNMPYSSEYPTTGYPTAYYYAPNTGTPVLITSTDSPTPSSSSSSTSNSFNPTILSVDYTSLAPTPTTPTPSLTSSSSSIHPTISLTSNSFNPTTFPSSTKPTISVTSSTSFSPSPEIISPQPTPFYSVTNDDVPTPMPMVESTSIPTTYYYEPTEVPSLPTEDLPSVPTSTSRVEPAPPAPPPGDEPPTTDEHHDYSNYMDLSALHQKEPIEGNPLDQADIHYKSSQENVFEVITQETYMPTQDPTIPSSIEETMQEEEDGPVIFEIISTEDDEIMDDEIMRIMSPHFVDEGPIQAHYDPVVTKEEDDEPSNKNNKNNKFSKEEDKDDGEEETTNIWVGSVNLWTEKEVEEEVIKTEPRMMAPHTIVKKHDGINPQQQPREVAKDNAEGANPLWVGTVNLWKDKDAQIINKKEDDSYNDFLTEKANKDPYSDSTEEAFKVDSSNNLWKEGYESSHFAGGRLRVMNSSSRVVVGVVGASVAIIALASVGIGLVML